MYGEMTFDQLITYILSHLDLPFLVEEQPEDTVNAICQDNCISWETFNRQVLNQETNSPNYYEYCAAIKAIQNLKDSDYKDEVTTWLDQFDVEAAYLEEREDFQIALNSLSQQLNLIELDSMENS